MKYVRLVVVSILLVPTIFFVGIAYMLGALIRWVNADSPEA